MGGSQEVRLPPRHLESRPACDRALHHTSPQQSHTAPLQSTGQFTNLLHQSDLLLVHIPGLVPHTGRYPPSSRMSGKPVTGLPCPGRAGGRAWVSNILCQAGARGTVVVAQGRGLPSLYRLGSQMTQSHPPPQDFDMVLPHIWKGKAPVGRLDDLHPLEGHLGISANINITVVPAKGAAMQHQL